MRLRKMMELAIVALALVLPGRAAQAKGAKPGLFVNLTTDNTWSAAKVIRFAHEKAPENGFEPVAIWLNLCGVYLPDDVQVILCSACLKAAGLTKDGHIDGITMGTWPAVQGLVFDPNVKTLAWQARRVLCDQTDQKGVRKTCGPLIWRVNRVTWFQTAEAWR